MKFANVIKKVIKFIKLETLRAQKVFIIDGELFYNGRPTGVRNDMVVFNKRHVLKVELYQHRAKKNRLIDEAKIIEFLNEKGCVCCPKLIKQGKLKDGRDYMIIERIIEKGKYGPAELFFSMLEQKGYGVFHGDIKPENIIFDGSIAMLIDYDQADFRKDIVKMSGFEYLEYFANKTQERYVTFFADNYGLENGKEFINKSREFFKNDALNMANVNIFNKTTKKTCDKENIYNFENGKVFIKGICDIKSRKKILGEIPFKPNERVLSYGCTMRQLGFYLDENSYEVYACDTNRDSARMTKMLSSIMDKKCTLLPDDFIPEEYKGKFDTICLFPTLQEEKSVQKIVNQLADSKTRILMECKPSEFNLNNIEDLVNYFKQMFPGFNLEKVWGQTQDEYYITSMVQ